MRHWPRRPPPPSPVPPATASRPASRPRRRSARARRSHAADAGGFDYAPSPLPGWWRVAPAPNQTEAAEAFAAAAGVEDALVASPEGDLAERLVALLEAPLAAATADTLAGLPLVELPVDHARPADGRGLLGRRRLARYRQGHRRPPAGQGHPGRGRRQPALLLVGEDPGADRRRSRPDHRPLSRGVAAARRRPDRLLVRRRRPALRLQPADHGRAGAASPGWRCWACRTAPTS